MPKYFSYSFGLSDLNTRQCTIQKISFGEFLDEMKPNPTQDTIQGSYLLLPTHPHLQRSIFFVSPSPSTYLPTYLLLFPSLLFSFPSPFLTHNLFFFLCDLFIVSYFSSFFGFPSPFFVFSFFLLSLCVCVCVCVGLCVEPWKTTRATKRGERDEKRNNMRSKLEEMSLLQPNPCKPMMLVKVCCHCQELLIAVEVCCHCQELLIAVKVCYFIGSF